MPLDVEDLLRELTPQVLGTLARRCGDFDAAEDAVQEALLAAAHRWPRDGVPPDPRGWLLRTAGLRLIDLRRSEQSRRRRETVSDEAIRLTRMVRQHLPDDPEVAGLLALLLLIDARRPARATADGAPVPLAEQDRTLWDRACILEGLSLVDEAWPGAGWGVPAPGGDRRYP